MVEEFRPRPNDHIVEPVFAALRPDGERGDRRADELGGSDRRRARGPRAVGLTWRLALAILCLLALAWVVKLVAGA